MFRHGAMLRGFSFFFCTFYIGSIYHNPDLDDSIFDCLLMTMVIIQENDVKASFVFIGDFNVHHRDWLSSVSPTDGHGLRALDISSESGCEQIICKLIHRSDNCLDLLITNSPGVVADSVGTPIGTSDHSAICATI